NQLSMDTTLKDNEISHLKLENESLVKNINDLKSENESLLKNINDLELDIKCVKENNEKDVLEAIDYYKKEIENYNEIFEEQEEELKKIKSINSKSKKYQLYAKKKKNQVVGMRKL